MAEVILRKPEVKRRTGYSDTTLWRKSTDPDDDFPAARRLGQNSIGWLESEIGEWIESRVRVGVTPQGETDEMVGGGIET